VAVSIRKDYELPLPVRRIPAGFAGFGRGLVLGPQTLVMGVLNITPDSFSDGGLRFDRARAIDDGLQMIEDGAHIIDIGGESTRPGADSLAADEELRRVLPVVERLAREDRAVVSIDTYKAVVAREAIDAGADIVNDISGLQFDPALGAVVAEKGAAIVLMHMRGRSREMYQEAVYDDVMGEVVTELEQAIGRALAAGVLRDSMIVDPGIGFAKRADHSLATLARLPELARLDRPLLVGPSRKSFLKAALGDVPPLARDWGTAAAVTASVLSGAHIVRVHAVREMAQVVRVADQIRGASAQRPASSA
jgi:dihydropteroate synthase